MTLIDFNHYRGTEIADMIVSNLQMEAWLQIIKTLNPTFSKDGNRYCYLYGTLPNDCIFGFGETPHKAMIDFCQNFYSHSADQLKVK